MKKSFQVKSASIPSLSAILLGLAMRLLSFYLSSSSLTFRLSEDKDKTSSSSEPKSKSSAESQSPSPDFVKKVEVDAISVKTFELQER
jgi:hypothetical protein